MGDRNIRKETKKPKKSDKKSVSNLDLGAPRAAVMQPELIKKEKKHK